MAALAVLFVFACSEESDPVLPDPNEGLIEVASQSIAESEYEVRMFLAEGQELEVGYNKLSLGLFDGEGNHVSNAHLSIMPMMTMMEMSHSSPYETMDHEMGSDKYQEFAVVFVMPSGEMGSWALEVTAHIMDESFSGEASLSVDVLNPEIAKMKAMDLGENGRIFISLVGPADPIVGSNDFEIVIHERESMMSWPAITDYSIEIEPEMPAMGHGSPNNENPVHQQLGHYKGLVNFTMTGEWVVHVTINEGSNQIAETDFEIVF